MLCKMEIQWVCLCGWMFYKKPTAWCSQSFAFFSPS